MKGKEAQSQYDMNGSYIILPCISPAVRETNQWPIENKLLNFQLEMVFIVYKPFKRYEEIIYSKKLKRDE